jgi:hypothetical protein
MLQTSSGSIERATEDDATERSESASPRDSIFMSEVDQKFSSSLFETATIYLELCQKLNGVFLIFFSLEFSFFVG